MRLLALKVITCEELANFFPITFYIPFIGTGIESQADKVHSLAGASHEGSNLRVGEVTGQGMDEDGTGIGTLFEVAVKDKDFGQFGEPVNFVQNGSVKGSLSHLYGIFLTEHFLFGICSGRGIKKAFPFG